MNFLESRVGKDLETVINCTEYQSSNFATFRFGNGIDSPNSFVRSFIRKLFVISEKCYARK